MSKRPPPPPPPDPVSVLRGHRASVMDVCFHPSEHILYSGSADGELRIWDTLQHRPLASAWVHSAAHGIISVSATSAEVISQGRDGTVKFWDIGDAAFSRTPLLTIRTNAYHFCKLSLVKIPMTPIIKTVPQKSHQELEDSKIGDGIHDETEGSQIRSSGGYEVEEQVEGPKYVALPGEDVSMVEVWDISNSKRVTQLYQCSDDSKKKFMKKRGYFE